MNEDIFVKVVFDSASFWLGNKLVHDLNPRLEHAPNLQNLFIWILGNLFIRYDMVEYLKKKKVILTNDDIYFFLGILSSFINLGLGESLEKVIKVNSVGTLSNILMSRIVKPKK